MVKTDLTAVDWLLASDEPWTRYRTYLDLHDLPSPWLPFLVQRIQVRVGTYESD